MNDGMFEADPVQCQIPYKTLAGVPVASTLGLNTEAHRTAYVIAFPTARPDCAIAPNITLTEGTDLAQWTSTTSGSDVSGTVAITCLSLKTSSPITCHHNAVNAGEVRRTSQLLHSGDGHLRAVEVTATMGPSGTMTTDGTATMTDAPTSTGATPTVEATLAFRLHGNTSGRDRTRTFLDSIYTFDLRVPTLPLDTNSQDVKMGYQTVEEGANAFEAVPGTVLLALLVLVAAGFILVPGSNDGNVSFFHRSIRVSPLVCLYYTIQCIVEICTIRYTGSASSTDPSKLSDTPTHLPPTRTWPARILRTLAIAAFLALSALRHAFWTQAFAALYIVHWGLHNAGTTHARDRLSSEQAREAHRIGSNLFALAGHCVFYRSPTQPLSRLTLGLSNGTIAAVVSAATAFVAHDVDRSPNTMGFLGQSIALTFTCVAWFFAFFPVAIPHKALPESATELERLNESLLAAVHFHIGAFCFFSSRRSLERAHPFVPAAVAVLWFGAAAFYYDYWYPVYAVLGPSTAERPTLAAIRGSGPVGR